MGFDQRHRIVPLSVNRFTFLDHRQGGFSTPGHCRQPRPSACRPDLTVLSGRQDRREKPGFLPHPVRFQPNAGEIFFASTVRFSVLVRPMGKKCVNKSCR